MIKKIFYGKEKYILLLLLTPIFIFLRPTLHLLQAASNDINELPPTPNGFIDDASRLNQTKIAELWQVPIDHQEPEKQITTLLKRAKEEKRHISIAGAKHSMGGHTIYPDGIIINMLPWNTMALDKERNILRVQSGALWKDIIAYLETHDRSVAVMQSNNSFSVGGSLSANCHGWQFKKPPIASTVQSFRLMKADGKIVHCSRQENKELFSLVLGGYGLFGIILDAKLRVVPNERYRKEQFVIEINDALKTLEQKVTNNKNCIMAYGRLNIATDQLFDQAIINAYYQEQGELPALTEPGLIAIRRHIFRASANDDYGKKLRWGAESKLQPLISKSIVSRNQLLNESVDVFQNRSSDSRDILHEYFVPRQQVGSFLQGMKGIIPKFKNIDLLNVTVRDVKEDKDSFLRYADQDMMAFVMLFYQKNDPQSEAEMQNLTQELIDNSLRHQGRYYLPYRLHATNEQFHRAYPQAKRFFELKRHYDPNELFQNMFYLKYGKTK